MSWYLAYLISVTILWVFSSPRDRNSLRIILLAGVGSLLLMASVRGVVAPWKMVLPATVEILTIAALLKWAKNLTGVIQVGLLVFAWALHALCWVDLVTGSNMVYDRYSSLLGAVAVGQLIGCYDTLIYNGRRIISILGGRPSSIPAGSGLATTLHSPGRPGI